MAAMRRRIGALVRSFLPLTAAGIQRAPRRSTSPSSRSASRLTSALPAYSAPSAAKAGCRSSAKTVPDCTSRYNATVSARVGLSVAAWSGVRLRPAKKSSSSAAWRQGPSPMPAGRIARICSDTPGPLRPLKMPASTAASTAAPTR